MNGAARDPRERDALHVAIRGISPAAGRRGEHPVILLHAFPLDSRMWRPVADILAARGVIAHALDYPGFGIAPPWPDVNPSIDAIADAAVVTLRDGIGAGAAHWVGNSMGGYVALAILDRHPEAVAGMGLVGTRATADTDAARAKRYAMAESMAGLASLPDPRGMAEPLIGAHGPERAALVDAATAIIADQAPAAVAWGQLAMAARPDRTDVLRGFGGPSFMVRGRNDAVVSDADVEPMAEALGVDVTWADGVGHLIPLEAPEVLARSIAGLTLRAQRT